MIKAVFHEITLFGISNAAKLSCHQILSLNVVVANFNISINNFKTFNVNKVFSNNLFYLSDYGTISLQNTNIFISLFVRTCIPFNFTK